MRGGPNTGNQTTSYAYDPDGNLVTLTDANGHPTSNGYDLLYELTTKTLPDSTSTEKRTYDFAGNLQTLTSFNGYTTTSAYDGLNRLTSQTPDSRTGEPVVSFTYMNTGKRHTMTDASGTTGHRGGRSHSGRRSTDRLYRDGARRGRKNRCWDTRESGR